jgi:hypothetical protein
MLHTTTALYLFKSMSLLRLLPGLQGPFHFGPFHNAYNMHHSSDTIPFLRTHVIDQVPILAPGDPFGYLNALCLLSRAVSSSWRPIKIYSHVSPLSYREISFQFLLISEQHVMCSSLLSLTPELVCRVIKDLPIEDAYNFLLSCRQIYSNGKYAFDEKCFRVFPVKLES